MRFYIVQHGVAVEKAINPDRPLTLEGRDEIGRLSVYLSQKGVSDSSIYHSGKTRAKETAQLLAEHLSDIAIGEHSGLGPNDDVSLLADRLEDNAMYVGHLPHLSKLVSYVITGDVDTGVVTFVNGGVVCLNKDREAFQIDWYLRPEHIL